MNLKCANIKYKNKKYIKNLVLKFFACNIFLSLYLIIQSKTIIKKTNNNPALFVPGIEILVNNPIKKLEASNIVSLLKNTHAIMIKKYVIPI